MFALAGLALVRLVLRLGDDAAVRIASYSRSDRSGNCRVGAPVSSWHKTAQTHMTTTWPNEPRVSVASKAHGPRTRLSHVHICSSFLYNVFLHPELYNYFLFYTFSKLHLWWV